MTDARGILFDMDGLLLDTERLALETFVALTVPGFLTSAEAEGHFMDLIGSSSVQTRARVAEILPSDADHDRFHTDWNVAFHARTAEGIPLKPGAREVVEDLAARGRVMAIVTSSKTETARRHLGHVGLLQHFVAVIGGDAVANNKPHPEPYETGAAAIGRMPADCVAFEDSDTGIAAAMAAGCDGWQVPDLRPPGRSLPDLGQNRAATLTDAARGAGLL